TWRPHLYPWTGVRPRWSVARSRAGFTTETQRTQRREKTKRVENYSSLSFSLLLSALCSLCLCGELFFRPHRYPIAGWYRRWLVGSVRCLRHPSWSNTRRIRGVRARWLASTIIELGIT